MNADVFVGPCTRTSANVRSEYQVGLNTTSHGFKSWATWLLSVLCTSMFLSFISGNGITNMAAATKSVFQPENSKLTSMILLSHSMPSSVSTSQHEANMFCSRFANSPSFQERRLCKWQRAARLQPLASCRRSFYHPVRIFVWLRISNPRDEVSAPSYPAFLPLQYQAFWNRCLNCNCFCAPAPYSIPVFKQPMFIGFLDRRLSGNARRNHASKCVLRHHHRNGLLSCSAYVRRK